MCYPSDSFSSGFWVILRLLNRQVVRPFWLYFVGLPDNPFFFITIVHMSWTCFCYWFLYWRHFAFGRGYVLAYTQAVVFCVFVWILFLTEAGIDYNWFNFLFKCISIFLPMFCESTCVLLSLAIPLPSLLVTPCLTCLALLPLSPPHVIHILTIMDWRFIDTAVD